MSDPDAFAFPQIQPELRPLFLAVMEVLRLEQDNPRSRPTIPENTLRNRVRHAFEDFRLP